MFRQGPSDTQVKSLVQQYEEHEPRFFSIPWRPRLGILLWTEVRVIVGKWLGMIPLDLDMMVIAYHTETIMQDSRDMAIMVALYILW